MKPKETLIILLVVGIAGYLISLYFGVIWLGLGILMLSGTFFIGYLVGNSRQYFESKWAYRIITVFALSIVAFHALRFATDFERRDYKKNLMLQSRKTIDEGISKNTVQSMMLEILREYQTGEYKTINETVNANIGERLQKGGVFLSYYDLLEEKPEEDDDTDFFYVMDEGKDSFQVIVVPNIPNGKDPGFENYNGKTGRFQMEFTLTKEGVKYEEAN